MKRTTIIALAALLLTTTARGATIDYTFNVQDPFGQNPFFVDGAFIRTEAFAPNISYWQPSSVGVFGEVVYKFDFPDAIQTANLDARILAHNGVNLPNFDPGSAAYLDVSADGTAWTNIGAVEPGVLSDLNLVDFDISSLVAGSTEVFVRARLLQTVAISGFSGTQFMRQSPSGAAGENTGEYYDPFSLQAVTVPEPSGLALGMIALCALLWPLFRRRR